MSVAEPAADHLLLRAIRGETLPRVPVWLMRQAGRSDPDYRAYRARAGLDLYTLFRSPEHAVPISLLPRRIGVDAIIMYQDILTPLEPMGATFHFQPGPVLAEPIRHADQVAALHLLDDPATQMPYIAGTIGGLLLAQFGRVPEFGDVVTLGDRFEFRVVKANNRRIITLEMNVLD